MEVETGSLFFSLLHALVQYLVHIKFPHPKQMLCKREDSNVKIKDVISALNSKIQKNSEEA